MIPEPPSPESLTLLSSKAAIPLGFVRDGDRVFLIARQRSAQWPVDVLRTGRARLQLPNSISEGAVELVSDPGEQQGILGQFRQKYGEQRFLRWYDRPARILRVDLLPDGASALAGEDPGRYERWLRSEFDSVAPDYDHHITGNRINRLLRDRSLARLRRVFASSRRLLEVGCGSGMETLPLLREGHEILAVDISPRMLEVVREKARTEGISERLQTRVVRARDLATVVAENGEGSFDGAYSTYGALNCEPDLRPIAAAFRRLLVPNGHLILGVYNRWCLFELVGYSLSLQTDRALGRREIPVPVGASRFCVDVYAYSAPEVIRLFADGFRLESMEGVPILLPPSDLTGYAEKFARHFERLAAWDAWVGRRWPFSTLGDHFLLSLVRR